MRTSCWFPFALLNDLRLSIAAKRMAAQNVLVKDLQGVETLGMSQSSVTAVTPDASSSRLGEFFKAESRTKLIFSAS